MERYNFAMRLREWRESAGMTGADVARIMGINASDYYPIENGAHRPSAAFIGTLQRRFGRLRIPDPVEEIMDEERRGCIGIIEEFAQERESDYEYAQAALLRRAIKRIQRGRRNVWIEPNRRGMRKVAGTAGAHAGG